MQNTNKKTVAIIGAVGQIGIPMTRTLLSLGHDIIVITRGIKVSKQEVYDEFRSAGAQIRIVSDMYDEAAMSKAYQGADVAVVATSANKEIITVLEPIWLQAALDAGVSRFVPNEFGCHTQSLNFGDGVLFDYKKQLQQKILDSSIEWTLIFNGIIYDYCLPNLRFFEKITTFGELDIPIYTHHIDDIGKFAALAVVDERTANRCVQMDYQSLTQQKMIDLLKKNFPNYPFEYKHYSTEFITKAKDVASDDVSAKQGSETDQERWGINNVVYVLGKLAGFTDETVRASELWPDFKMIKTAQEMLADPAFVFEAK